MTEPARSCLFNLSCSRKSDRSLSCSRPQANEPCARRPPPSPPTCAPRGRHLPCPRQWHACWEAAAFSASPTVCAPGGRAVADGPHVGRQHPGCPRQRAAHREAATLAFDPHTERPPPSLPSSMACAPRGRALAEASVFI
jgi:hypothetical protein